MTELFGPIPSGELTPAQRRLIAELHAGDQLEEGALMSEIALAGPFDALMRTPKIGLDLARIGGRFRHQAALPDATRELLVCWVAARVGSAFEWHAHAPHALELGMTKDDLDWVRRGVVPAGLSEFDRAALGLGRDLMESAPLTDEQRITVVAILGESVVVEIAVLVGFYQLISHVLEISGRNNLAWRRQ